MPLVLVGLDHRSAPQEILQRTNVASDELAHLLEMLTKSEHITEAVVLSTCMRTEIYVEAVRYHGAVHDLHVRLCEVADVDRASLSACIYELVDDAAVSHLFRVASGLESSVLGEPEVLGQVARAWDLAREQGAARSMLNNFFRHAVETGKRARTETAISRSTTSFGQAAVAMARQVVGTLEHKRVLLVGAGNLGESLARSLVDSGSGVYVTNRTEDKAVNVAEIVNCAVFDFELALASLDEFDVVFCSTASKVPVITAAAVSSALQRAPEHQLLLVDLGVPPDVEDLASQVANVTVLDIADLNARIEQGRALRQAHAAAVEEIVEFETRRYGANSTARTVTPVLVGLRSRLQKLVIAEAAKQKAHAPEAEAAIDAFAASLTAKLLHEPTVRLKGAAGTPEGERLAESVKYLFDL